MSASEFPATADVWAERVRRTFERYSEPLLRQVTSRLLRPRNQWPAEELIERSVETLRNAVVIDRRLKDLPVSSRRLLAAVGISGQPVWRIGHLLSLLAVFDHVEGLTPIQTLMEAGLLYPELRESSPPIKQWEDWLGIAEITHGRVFAHPAVTARCRSEDLGLPELPARSVAARTARVGDGLEWLLRTAGAWQQIRANPIRLTQQHALFKRDLQRLQSDPLLNVPFADHLENVAESGVFALELAVAAGLIEASDTGLTARPIPTTWDSGLAPVTASFWQALLTVESWDPLHGYFPAEAASPLPSVALAAILLLTRQPSSTWVRPADIASFIAARHPSWASVLKGKGNDAASWMRAFLFGVAYQLRLIEAASDGTGLAVRLSDVGRYLFGGGPAPGLDPDFPQTLVVQPNGEVVVYRQGLSPELISKLSRFAAWKTLGAACTMDLQADTVYAGLESGLSLNDMVQLLQQRGARALPANVLDSLRRWANKRERVTIYSGATLLEFAEPADLEAAFTRGLVSAKLTDRIGLAENGEGLDFKHFRLVGNRDYEARPQKCVHFDADGVTFTVDTVQSDLLLEAELSRFAEPSLNGEPRERRYMLTPASLRSAESQGLTLADLEQWSLERSGQPLSPAARLLFLGSGGTPGHSRQRLVVTLPSEPVTDGVVQWPATGSLIEERLGPCAISVSPKNLEALIRQLAVIGVVVESG